MRRPLFGVGVGRRGVAGAGTILSAVAALLLAVPTVRASATPPLAVSAPGRVLPADTVAPLPADPVVLGVPADGRVNGYRFSGQILGAATGTALPGPGGLRAGTGQRLWVFGVRYQPDVIFGSDGLATAITPVTAAVAAGGERIPVPLRPPAVPDSSQPGTPTTADSGAEYFAASLPATATNVAVELVSDGYAQDFSLTHMARQGAQPAALYRQPQAWQTVATVGFEKDLPTPFNDGSVSLPNAALVIQVPRVALSYFGPDGTSDPAPTAGQAWLIPTLADPMQDTVSPGQDLQYGANVTAADMTLTLPDGTVVHPKTLPGGPDPARFATDGSTDSKNLLFPYQYAFAVPATLTTASLTINIPAQPAFAAYGGGPTITVDPGPVTIPIILPPQQAPLPPDNPATTPALIKTTSASPAATPTGSASSRASGIPGWIIPTAVLVVLLLAAGIILAARRRHPPAPDDPTGSDHPPATDSSSPSPSPGGAAPYSTAGYDPPSGPQDAASAPREGVGNGSATVANGDRPQSDDHDTTAETVVSPPVEDRRFEPPTAPLLPGPAVLILGDTVLAGWKALPTRTAITQLAVYLAVHADRPTSTETLLTALADGEEDRDVQWLRSTASRLRANLGDGHLPDAVSAGGYQLHDVACDWTTFNTLAAQAGAAERAGDTNAAMDSYGQALALVRGVPLVGVDYRWIDTETLRTHIETRIAETGRTLARLALTAGQPDLAIWAAHQALLADPLDETTAAVALRSAAATGAPGAVRNQWTAITRTLTAHGLEPSPELNDIYQQLTVTPTDMPSRGTSR